MAMAAYLEYNPAMREKIQETVQLVYAEVSTRSARELRSGIKTGVTPSLKDVSGLFPSDGAVLKLEAGCVGMVVMVVVCPRRPT